MSRRITILGGLLALLSLGGAAGRRPELGPTPASRIAAPTPVETAPRRSPGLPLLMPFFESGRLTPDEAIDLLDRPVDQVFQRLSGLPLQFQSDCVEVASLDAPDVPDSIDVLHYDIEILEVDETVESVRGRTTVSFTPLKRLYSADLHLAAVEVTALDVFQDGAFQPAIYTHVDSVLHVRIPESVPGDTLRIRVTHFDDDPTCTSVKGLLSGVDFTPVGVHTFAEPSYARHWFPAHDVPWDKATVRLAVNAPPGRVASASGVLVETGMVNGQERSVWEIDKPISTYLIAFYLQDYVKLETSTPGGVALEYFTYDYLVDATWIDFKNIPDMVEFYSDVWVPYPNPRYAMSLGFFGGGMEHQMNSLIGYFFIRGNVSNEQLFSHELAHQWWGNLVTMRTWRDIWLNEGFATFSEWIYDEHKYGWDRMRASTAVIDSIFIARLEDLDHPILDPPLDNIFSFAVYQKGGRVLDMLRGVSRLLLMSGPPRPPGEWESAALGGDDRFFRIFNRYATEFAYGNASTADFQRVAEGEFGQDLDWFFDPWLRGTGYPALVYDVVSTYTASTTYLDVQVQQTQEATRFDMPLQVRYRSGDTVLDEVRRIGDAASQWRVALPPGNWEVTLDPDDWLMDTAERVCRVPEAREVGIFPNPSSIGFTVTANLEGTPAPVSLTVFDVRGRRVRAQDLGIQDSECIAFRWDGMTDDGRRAPAGAYFGRLRIGNRVSTHRLVVLP